MSKEHVGGLFFLCVGLYTLSHSATLPMGLRNQPGPGVFPLFVSIFLCIVGVAIFLSGKQKPKIVWGSIKQQGKLFKISLLSLGFIFAFVRVGFLLSSFFYLLGIFLWVCRFKLWYATGVSLLTAIVSWYFFGRILALHFPKGPWGL